MAQISEHARPSEPRDAAGFPERRRPGRIETVTPALIPLLRGENLRDSAPSERVRDDLDPVRGIGLGVLLGVLLWAGVVLGLYWVLGG